MRYERARPGELIHRDTKKLGRIDGLGHRITGDRRTERGRGWDHVHVGIDDATRLGYSEVLADEKRETAIGFLHRALGFPSGHGITVERVMTDNGSAYRSRAFTAAGAKHKRTRPYTPRTHGKAERFIQTHLREWAYARPYESSQQRTAALTPWPHYDNTERPHAGLARCPPALRLTAQLLGSTKGTVASSRPAPAGDRGSAPGQGSPKATGDSRRDASLRRSAAAVTIAQGGTLA